MIIVTGGAGFIGSAFVWKLNEMGRDDVVVVDNLGHSEKWRNLVNRSYLDYVHKDTFLDMVLDDQLHWDVEAIVHMGACSSTTETDADYLMDNNFRYSKALCRWALEHGVRFVNASSASTYGDGTQGFSDDPALIQGLKPLNMYGYTKQLFDLWALREGAVATIPSLKFFNVFGPNEYHKDSMRSVVCKAFLQILETGRMQLFKSTVEGLEHGGQQRDFIYVKDVAEVLWWLLEHPEVNGVFNVGTSVARSFHDLAVAVFKAMGRETAIDFVDMPESLRPKYQSYTKAEMERLGATGCPIEFMCLEDAILDYVQGYLAAGDPFL